MRITHKEVYIYCSDAHTFEGEKLENLKLQPVESARATRVLVNWISGVFV